MSSNKYLQHSHDESAPWFDDGPLVKRVVRVGDPNVNGIDTSAIDAYRQGVELTTMRHFDAGIGKISSGEPGHLLKQSSFGGAIARRQIETLKSRIIIASPFTPIDLVPKWWHRADLGVTLTSGKVSQWDDLSGNGYHWTQTDAAKRPSPYGSGTSAKIVFTEADSTNLNRPTIQPYPAAYTFIAVMNIQESAGYHMIFETEGGLGLQWVLLDAAPTWKHAGAGFLAVGTTGLRHYDITWDGTNIRQRSNGGAFTASRTITILNDADDYEAIGAFYNGVWPTDMEIYEMMYFERVLSAEELAMVRTYITSRYGI